MLPLLNTKWSLVAELGADPKPLSALILIDPALIVVEPLNEFTPEIINSPEPSFTKLPDPLITPESVWLDEDEYCKIPLLIMLLE